jgi:drug/metabolite transporter (DMT)-like permease
MEKVKGIQPSHLPTFPLSHPLTLHLSTLRAALPRRLKGVILVFASAACVSVTFIASKQAMQELSPLGFTPIWFAVASAWGVGVYLLRYQARWPTGLSASLRPLLALGLLNGLANYLFFTSIDLGDPTLVAFFSRSETIYTVLLGAWLLGERMRRYQWLGVGVAIAGAGLMTFRAGQVVWLMLWLTLMSNFFQALSTVIAKKSLSGVPPLLLSTLRAILMMVFLGLAGWVAGQLAWPGLTTWLWIIGGAFFGPFLSYFLFYKSLHYLDISKGAVIRAMQPLFVAVYSLILFGTVISLQQFVGGLTMIAGVILMLWERR